ILPGIQLAGGIMQRRNFLGAVAVPLLVARASITPSFAAQSTAPAVQRKGRLKQGVTMGVFAGGTSVEYACREAARLGIKGFDLRGPADWPTLKKYGLVSSMYQPTAGASIPNGLNRKENHARIDQGMRAAIDESAAAGVPNLITFSGNRAGMADAEGADNCVAFLNNI